MPPPDISSLIGLIPHRMAFAGGWIDQPFLSALNPAPPGSMVVINLHPTFPWMDRAGMASGTRKVALKLWPNGLPPADRIDLVKQLYAAENAGLAEPSGSQDMIGLIYPGVSRLDFVATHEGGIFPSHIESNNDPAIARWLERVIHVLPVAPRPEGYNPLLQKNLDPDWIRRLGQTGKDCYNAILKKNAAALGASFNECMACWAAILPCTVRHPKITADLPAIQNFYKNRYAGAMYSGCGGGYLYIVSETPVPGTFSVQVRTA